MLPGELRARPQGAPAADAREGCPEGVPGARRLGGAGQRPAQGAEAREAQGPPGLLCGRPSTCLHSAFIPFPSQPVSSAGPLRLRSSGHAVCGPRGWERMVSWLHGERCPPGSRSLNKDFASLPSYQRQASCGSIGFKSFKSLRFCTANLTLTAADLLCKALCVTSVLLPPLPWLRVLPDSP